MVLILLLIKGGGAGGWDVAVHGNWLKLLPLGHCQAYG